MRVLVAGATGVLGRQLLPLLTSVGHEVIGLARTPERAPAVRALGASPLVADLRDGDSLRWAVAGLHPEAVVHLATAIPPDLNPRHMDRDFAATNALRTVGLRNLIAAVPAARLIAQSVAFGYQPGPGLADEDAPLLADPPKGFTRRWLRSSSWSDGQPRSADCSCVSASCTDRAPCSIVRER
jgi:nucleoside-diphosphate-sugar epimerase